jgi:hypothetical protein
MFGSQTLDVDQGTVLIPIRSKDVAAPFLLVAVEKD